MTDKLDFAGRSALVTGAASGIGAACARWLDAQGIARLILVDRDAEGLAALELGCEVECHTADVSDEAFWDRMDTTLESLDHVIVNAGIGAFAPIAHQSMKDWRRVMSVNLDGAFMTLRTGLRAMKKSGGGSAVVVASVTGIKPVPGTGAYGVAKAAVAHMARIAAVESIKNNIRVNAIAPGGVDTAIWDSGEDFQKMVAEHGREAAIKAMASTTPRGQYATPDELAGEIGFLLSDMAANITGTVLTSDGGFSF